MSTMNTDILKSLDDLEALESNLLRVHELKQEKLKAQLDQQAEQAKPKSKIKRTIKRVTFATVTLAALAYWYIPAKDLPAYIIIVILLGAALMLLLRGNEKRPVVDVIIEEIKGIDTFRVHYIANPQTIIDIKVADVKPIDGVKKNAKIEALAILELQKLLQKGQPECTRGKHKNGKYLSTLELRDNSPLKSGNYKHTDIAAWLVRNGLRYPDENQNPQSHLYSALKTAKNKGNGYWRHK